MKKLIVLATLLAVTASQGAVMRWSGNYFAGGDSNYANPLSWYDTADASSHFVPTAADSHALIGNASGAFGVIGQPVVSTDVGSDVPFTVGVGWDETYGELTIAAGGNMNVNNEMRVGWGGSVVSTGQVTVAGGTIVAGNLYLSNGAADKGTVQVTGGHFHAGTVHLGSGDNSIELGSTGVFYVNGDLTGLGFANGLVTSIDGGGTSIQESFDGSLTKFEVIPEPATLGLVAAVGGSLLFIRRKFMI